MGCALQEQIFSENDAFFAWTFVKRNPLWQTLLSFFWPVLTLAICLFPVYPHQCKLLILYSCAGVLLLILCLLAGKFFCGHYLTWTRSGYFYMIRRITIFSQISACSESLGIWCYLDCSWKKGLDFP